MSKCKWNGCQEQVKTTHCEAHRIRFNDAERAMGARKRRKPLNDDRCQKCFLRGHGENDCQWTASILAHAETREQAAARIGR